MRLSKKSYITIKYSKNNRHFERREKQRSLLAAIENRHSQIAVVTMRCLTLFDMTK